MKIGLLIDLAGDTARRESVDMRLHAIGAVGIRKDGAIVRSRNGSSKIPLPEAHAEARLCDKLDFGTPYVFVARVRKDGTYGMSKPCQDCAIKLKMKGVKRVYFTTNEVGVFGVYEP